MKEEDYKVVKEWYGEWQKIPTLLATAALALLAFSLTTLLPRSSTSSLTILRTCWGCLAVSALSASLSLFAAYTSFEILTRVRISDLLKNMSMKAPDANTKWIRRFGRASHRLAFLSLLALLAGAIGLALYAFKTIKPV